MYSLGLRPNFAFDESPIRKFWNFAITQWMTSIFLEVRVLTNISLFDQYYDFYQKLRFLTKTTISFIQKF